MSSVSLTVRRLSWELCEPWPADTPASCDVTPKQYVVGRFSLARRSMDRLHPPTHTHTVHTGSDWDAIYTHLWSELVLLDLYFWIDLFCLFDIIPFQSFFTFSFLYTLIEKTLNFDSLFQNALYTYVTEQVADFFQGIHCKQFKLLFCLLKRS